MWLLDTLIVYSSYLDMLFNLFYDRCSNQVDKHVAHAHIYPRQRFQYNSSNIAALS